MQVDVTYQHGADIYQNRYARTFLAFNLIAKFD